MRFWCGDDTLHKINSDYQHIAECCVTHIVGLPRHPATNEEMPLTPYQVDFCNKIIEITKLPQTASTQSELQRLINEAKRLHHFFHLNKGRQMGFTEIVLRLIQYFCFSRYAGSNVGIMAATNGNLARKDLRRFARLFLNIKPVVGQWIKQGVMRIVNDCNIEAFSASEEAITGDTRYKCIFMDEAAKWKLVEDLPVFNSVVPIVKASGGDLFLVSTPKGPLKMFYDIYKDETSEYVKLEYDITHTVGNLYTQKEVDDKLASKSLDPLQEYCCKFKLGQGSILNSVKDDERTTGWSHWDDEDIDDDIDDDDNFVEETGDYDSIHETD